MSNYRDSRNAEWRQPGFVRLSLIREAALPGLKVFTGRITNNEATCLLRDEYELQNSLVHAPSNFLCVERA